MSYYQGFGESGKVVFVDDKGRSSPVTAPAGGFDWGHCGKASERLALAILKRGVTTKEAVRLCKAFKISVIAKIGRGPDGSRADFILPVVAIKDWVILAGGGWLS